MPRRRSAIALLALAAVLMLWHTCSSAEDDLADETKPQDDKFLWRRIETIHPVSSFRPLPSRPTARLPRVQADFPHETAADRETRLARREAVREAFVRSWRAYERHAWLHDELAPVTSGYRDPLGGWGATLVDSLDTLWIMGMRDEFYRAVKALDEGVSFETTTADEINVFETTIRFLGGLLSAYDLSGDARLLRKARDVGDMLYKAFDTPNRMPITRWDMRRAAKGADQVASSDTLLAEIGSLTLEFARLSLVTKDPKYFDAVHHVSERLAEAQSTTLLPGLRPVVVDAAGLRFDGSSRSGGDFSLGGMADSTYEYLAKMVALLGERHGLYGDMYARSMDAAARHLLYRPRTPDNADILLAGTARASVREAEGPTEVRRSASASHLSCFAGGVLALGGRLFGNKTHIELGRRVAMGCVWAYGTTTTGVMPEEFYAVPCPEPDHGSRLDSGQGPDESSCVWSDEAWKQAMETRQAVGGSAASSFNASDFIASHNLPRGMASITDARYLLRPEAIESVFVLHRVTGEPAWAEHAWTMWRAVEALTRTGQAYSAVRSVQPRPGEAVELEDGMECFWMGETLKYFYLVFSEPGLVSLDEWVLNTEAHPFRRRSSLA